MFCVDAFNFFEHSLSTSNYNYLEIGIFFGESVCKLATKYPNKKIYAIDPFLEDGNTVHTSHVSKGERLETQRTSFYNNSKEIKNLIFYEMRSSEFLRKIRDQEIDGESLLVGNILIDGSHHYEDVVVDIELSMTLLGPKEGIIAFDDVGLVPDVDVALNEFKIKYCDRIEVIQSIGPISVVALIKKGL